MSLLSNWKAADFNTLEEGVLVAEHALAETGLFDDASLAECLDRQPDEALTLATMGEDSNTFEWRHGDRNGVSGADLLELVRQGHLWINCRDIMQHQPRLAELVNDLYDELEAGNRSFRAEDRTANLLISSPNALVHYHVDMPVNMLWHVRGRKRVWVYPPFDTRFASLTDIEKVCAGVYSDDVPYESQWDRYALVFDAQPGQLITWPQLTPHRVTNLQGLNVSLSTEHKNARARRRLNVYQANYLLRTRLGWQPRSANVYGVAAHAKQTLARAQRYCHKLLGKKPERFDYQNTFVIDLTQPRGIRPLSEAVEPILPPHLQAKEMQPA